MVDDDEVTIEGMEAAFGANLRSETKSFDYTAVTMAFDGRETDRLKPPPAMSTEDVRTWEDIWSTYGLDTQVAALKQKMVTITPQNKEFLFWRSDPAIFVSSSISNTILGEGITIQTDSEQVEEILSELMEDLSGAGLTSKRYTIADVIRDIVLDNALWGYYCVMKKRIGGELTFHRLDPKTLLKIEHPIYGWVKYYQYAMVQSDLPGLDDNLTEEEAKKRFESDKYKPATAGPYGLYIADAAKPHEINIPAKKVHVFDLYKKPPVDGILDVMLHRLWLLYYIRKASERFAGPVPRVRVGTADHFPRDEEKYQALIRKTAKMAAQWRFGDAISYPWWMEVSFEEIRGQFLVGLLTQIDYLDKIIVKALGSSMAFYEAKGAELATGRTIESVWLRQISGFREKIGLVLKDMFKEYLAVKWDGEPDQIPEFEVTWSSLTREDEDNFIQVIQNLFRDGLLKDMEEARALIQKHGGIELEPIEPEERAAMEAKQQEATERGGSGMFDSFEEDPHELLAWYQKHEGGSQDEHGDVGSGEEGTGSA